CGSGGARPTRSSLAPRATSAVRPSRGSCSVASTPAQSDPGCSMRSMGAAIGLDIGILAAIGLVALTALADQLRLVVGRRTRVSLSGPFLVAAALVGGPLVGACAGAATESFTRDPPRKRVLCSVAGALQGLAVGLVGAQLGLRGVSGAVVLATVGLITGFALNARLLLPSLRTRRAPR